ncbi:MULTISPECIES: restriction endonuclease subunit S [unclassified Myroides]|uniref:restriction endonuclease subunit S n=1 Tax=unclassified Myroides TaxID=2642485 RepID=UPI003101398C
MTVMGNKEWKDCRLSDIISLVGGGTPKTSVSEFWNGNIPWLSVVDFNTGRKYVSETEKHITDIGLQNSSTKLLEKGDIIISARGTVGALAILNETMAFNQSCYGIKALEKYSFNDFIFYLLKFTIANLKQFAHGGVFDTITRDTFREIEIKLPPLEEQKAIADVLSSLDDKIDLLHEQNQTLENLAETLFCQWFIEEAKEEWEECSLSRIATFLNGLACQKYPPKDGVNKLPVLKIKELTTGITDNSDWATNEVKSSYIIKEGDVIFAWSASLMVKIWNGEECVLNQHLFKVSSDRFPKWFYYFWCKQHLREFISIAQSHATTMGHIKRSDLDEAMVLIPSEKEIVKMTEKIEPLLNKMQINNIQIKTLTKLRDTLLPKLMSGEVRVKM